MAQEEITILRVHKDTREKLRKLAITERESYEEIINRLLGELKEEPTEDGLKERKQKLLKMGISNDIVSLLGIIPRVSLKDEKRMVREAIIKRMNK